MFFIDGGIYIYISETSHFMETQDLIRDDSEVLKTEQFNSIDINTPFDLELARVMYNSKQPYDL